MQSLSFINIKKRIHLNNSPAVASPERNRYKNTALYLAVFILFLYLLPYIVLGQNATHEIHDVLDYYVGILVSADKCGDLLNMNPESSVSAIMSGIPRYCFHNNFDMLVVFFSVFPPFTAYIINFLLVHIIGFVCMYLLLKKHILKKQPNTWIISGVSLFFAMLPLYPTLGLTLAGLPLVILACLNLYRKQGSRLPNLLLLVFFAFYSSFVYIGVFVLVLIGVAMIIDWIANKKLNRDLFIAATVLGVAYAIFNYLLLYQILLAKNFNSHREAWVSHGYNIKVVVWATYNMLVNGHYHAASLQVIIALLAVPAAVVYSLVKPSKPRPWLLFALLGLALVWAGFFGIFQWSVLVDLKEKYKFLKIFQWDRFYFFNPTLWSLIFALSLVVISTLSVGGKNIGKYIVAALLVLQIGYVLREDKFLISSYATLLHQRQSLPDELKGLCTYKEYFQESTFKEIKNYIHTPQRDYRVGCIGFEPAVAMYNGFYTIDGYMTSYPLKYKLRFRKIIEHELAKDSTARADFDEWGHKCYLRTADGGIGGEIEHLQLNTQALKDMPCNYIISALRIKNAEENDLRFLNAFESKESNTWFYLYQII